MDKVKPFSIWRNESDWIAKEYLYTVITSINKKWNEGYGVFSNEHLNALLHNEKDLNNDWPNDMKIYTDIFQ